MNYIVKRSEGDIERIRLLIQAIYLKEDNIPSIDSEFIGIYSDTGSTEPTKLDGDRIIVNTGAINEKILSTIASAMQEKRFEFPCSTATIYMAVTDNYMEEAKGRLSRNGYNLRTLTEEKIKGITSLESAVNMLLEME